MEGKILFKYFCVLLLSCWHRGEERLKAQIRATGSPELVKALNTNWHDTGAWLSTSKRKFYLNRSHSFQHKEVDQADDFFVWESRSLGRMWKVPRRTRFSDDKQAARCFLGMNQDDDLYLVFRNPKNRTQHLIIYDDTRNTWEPMENLHIPYIKKRLPHYSGYVNPSGQVVLLGIASFDTYGVEDLYVSFKEKNQWTPLLNLGETINTSQQEITPFLLKDMKTLIFASNGHPENQGSFDLYVSQRLDDTWKSWTKPKPLGPPINTRGAEYYFFWNQKKEIAYFSRNSQSDTYSDIYQVPVEWVEEENRLAFKSLSPKKEVFLPDKVLFYQSTDQFLPETFRNLDLLVEILLNHPKKKLYISGYTDNQGNFLDNLKLSHQRVKKVIQYLISQGISKERLSGRGYGSARPIASNKSEETRKMNRRVEFRFLED
ncbi:MAG: OmpA family protein [Cytophagales bacterium]|nr:OmpA family protein [Cytophagales bacterium]